MSAAATLVLLLLTIFSARPAPAADPIPLGYYGPADPAHPTGGTAWQGASLAIEEANTTGGYQTRPFRLIHQWDENPWTGGAAGVVRLAYEHHVIGIIGSIDGASTHLAEQVVAKARLPLIDPLSTDRTVNAAFVPWMFSILPDDQALMDTLAAALPPGPFVLLTSTAHDPRITTAAFLSRLNLRRPTRHIQFEDPTGTAARAAAIDCDFLVLLAGIEDSARLVRDLRTLRPDLPIYGSHQMARGTFLEQAGEAAEGLIFPVPFTVPPAFAQKFRTRFHHPPDYAALSTYDATNLLIAAIRQTGPNREAVRDALDQLSPSTGAAGIIHWNRLRRNESQCRLATFQHTEIQLK